MMARPSNRPLTKLPRDLLKRNYNCKNDCFLAAVVKICASAFTIPTRLVDLLWRV
jgi:hypothetical protein